MLKDGQGGWNRGLCQVLSGFFLAPKSAIIEVSFDNAVNAMFTS